MRWICAAALLWWAVPLAAADKLEIYFIDVEAGSATLLVAPGGESMLIDSGSRGQEGRVLAAMKAAGVNRIDTLLITHFHADHFASVPELARKTTIVNWVDHGPAVEAYKSEEWKEAHRLRFSDALYDAYLKERAKGRHIVAGPGDRLPVKGMEALIVTSAGKQIAQPLAGAGQRNRACDITPPRAEAENEDSQSVGTLVSFGRFRSIFLGDLTWNNGRRLMCPVNKIGKVDAFLTTHHAMSVAKERGGEIVSGYSACSEAEVWGLAPRVAVLNAAEYWHYSEHFKWYGDGRAWDVIHNSPGLEDFWQMHYQPQGGTKQNAPEQFIANMTAKACAGNWIRLSAERDGSFTMTNGRTGFTKRYEARR